MVISIVVYGMGYVGIPIAALLANIDGFNVIGIQRRSGGLDGKLIVLAKENLLSKGKNLV